MKREFNRRDFLKMLPIAASIPSLSGCMAYRLSKLDLNHPFLRSEFVDSYEKEAAIVSKAKLSWTDDHKVRVIYLKGTAYERGYQHGYLLRNEIQDNMG